jgi:hypothetical protein
MSQVDFQAALDKAKNKILHIALNSAFEFILQAVQAFFQDKPPPSLLPIPP